MTCATYIIVKIDPPFSYFDEEFETSVLQKSADFNTTATYVEDPDVRNLHRIQLLLWP